MTTRPGVDFLMLNGSSLMEVVYVGLLLAAVVICCTLGVHAFHQHRLESVQAGSTRKWMFWVYASVFLAAAAANLTQFCVGMAFRTAEITPLQLGYWTALLTLSYGAFLIGARLRNSS